MVHCYVFVRMVALVTMFEDVRKLQFFLDALSGDNPFTEAVEVPSDARDAMEWCAERSTDNIMQERENMISWIESEGRRLQSVCELLSFFKFMHYFC